MVYSMFNLVKRRAAQAFKLLFKQKNLYVLFGKFAFGLPFMRSPVLSVRPNRVRISHVPRSPVYASPFFIFQVPFSPGYFNTLRAAATHVTLSRMPAYAKLIAIIKLFTLLLSFKSGSTCCHTGKIARI